ncbi:MAG: SPOR domain-containing protein [Bacteroidales bacterium]|nr:SPOR domain-containing protein [Bacteroidales bacterium]
MKKLLVIVCVMLSLGAFAQVDTTQYGVITITQDSRIQELLNTHKALAKEQNGTMTGWRVQIYNSSGTNSRTEAQNKRKLFLSKYPDIGAYLIYQPPFFKIRVGDFRTKDEAYALYKKLLVDFPVSYLITDKINFPALQSEEELSDLDKLLQE